jgi:hypothetical protein
MRLKETMKGRMRFFVPATRSDQISVLERELVEIAGGFTATGGTGYWRQGASYLWNHGVDMERVTIMEVFYRQATVTEAKLKDLAWSMAESLIAAGEKEVMLEMDGEIKVFSA